jgi:hypothetical protein
LEHGFTARKVNLGLTATIAQHAGGTTAAALSSVASLPLAVS